MKYTYSVADSEVRLFRSAKFSETDCLSISRVTMETESAYRAVSPKRFIAVCRRGIFKTYEGWNCKRKDLPQQAEVAQGVPGRLRPRIFLTFRHYKGGRSSAKRTGRLYPR